MHWYRIFSVDCRKKEGNGLGERREQWTEILSWEPRAFLYHNFLVSFYDVSVAFYWFLMFYLILIESGFCFLNNCLCVKCVYELKLLVLFLFLLGDACVIVYLSTSLIGKCLLIDSEICMKLVID